MVPDFPYIKAVKINDCYTYKNLYVQIFEEEPFRHLILTGKNGSGKTTILNGIAYNVEVSKVGGWQIIHDGLTKHSNEPTVYHNGIAVLKKMQEKAEMVELKHLHDSFSDELVENQTFVYAYFKAYRRTRLNEVKTVTQDHKIEGGLINNSDPHVSSYIDVYDSFLYNSVVNNINDAHSQFSQYFKQYLVN